MFGAVRRTGDVWRDTKNEKPIPPGVNIRDSHLVTLTPSAWKVRAELDTSNHTLYAQSPSLFLK